MTFAELADLRYSVKSYSSRPIEADVLKQVLETAVNKAPTARNKQACRIYVLTSPKAMEKANALSRCIYGAPAALLFTYSKDEIFHYPDEPEHHSGDEDCSITATYVMLAAAEAGLGTCWVNFFTPARAKEAYALPENEEPVLLMPIGYAADGCEPLPNHTAKRPVDEVIHYL
ncbi:MAG: nitroreductase family protein [Solobacterium sp.]|nr:nitroreductase family protein [Solobacterium sp.]MBQ6356695.1 nitroreductase family protein [Solobacterium sp.]